MQPCGDGSDGSVLEAHLQLARWSGGVAGGQCTPHQGGTWTQDRCTRRRMDCRPLATWVTDQQFHSFCRAARTAGVDALPNESGSGTSASSESVTEDVGGY